MMSAQGGGRGRYIQNTITGSRHTYLLTDITGDKKKTVTFFPNPDYKPYLANSPLLDARDNKF